MTLGVKWGMWMGATQHFTKKKDTILINRYTTSVLDSIEGKTSCLFVRVANQMHYLRIEHDSLRFDLAHVLSGCVVPNCSVNDISVVDIAITGCGPYSVGLGEVSFRNNLSREEVIGFCLGEIERAFSRPMQYGKYALHASCVQRGDKQIVFAGASNSGKTSMAIAFGNYGNLLGDECAFLDMSSAHIDHEPFPFKVKKDNPMFECIPRHTALEADDSVHGRVFYVSAADMGCDVHSLRYGRISHIVFPWYDATAKDTDIERLPATELPKFILGSLMGPYLPSVLLVRFLHMCAAYPISFLKIRFHDAWDAAKQLDCLLSYKD